MSLTLEGDIWDMRVHESSDSLKLFVNISNNDNRENQLLNVPNIGVIDNINADSGTMAEIE